MTRLRAVVADDTPAFLEGITVLVKDRCEIVATARDGFEALDAIEQSQPDLAVLDLSMPRLNGLEVAARALSAQSRLAVILCTIDKDDALIEAAAQAGAKGYVCKINLYRDLLPALDAITAGGVFFPS
jgi:DNA-binding NarL/FixJ family response regulator